MKLRYEFEIMEMGEEFVAVPVGENADKLHAMLQMNDVGVKMLRYIGESDTPEEVFGKLCADYPEDDKDDIGDKLCDFLNQLAHEGIIIP